MSNTITSPNMNMVLPVPGQEPGPDYANDITNALNDVVDAHDHSSGKGLKITPVGLNINSDLSMQGNNLNLPRAVRFLNNSTTLAGVGDINCVYSDSGNLYFNNGTGTAVQVTAGSALNSAALVNNAYSFLAVSGNHTISSSDSVVIFSTDTGTAVTYTLPRANAVAKGRLYIIKDVTGHAGTNNITINTVSGDTVDNNGTSLVIASNYSSVWLISDGASNWNILYMYKGVSGDLSGTLPSPTVIKLQGNAVTSQTLGSAQDGYALQWDNADGYWKGSTVPVGGNLSGITTNATVTKVNNASVPAAGSLTTGNVLQVSGASALSYAPINLAGGANYVSGALPTANQVSQALGGDLSGTTAAGTVIKIQGNPLQSGALGSTQDGYVLSWNNGNSQWQATNLATGGIVVLAGDVTGFSNATTVAKVHGSTVPIGGSLTTGNILQVSGASALSYAALNLAGGANFVTGNLPITNVAPGSNGQVHSTVSGTSGWNSFSGDVTFSTALATTVTAVSTTCNVTGTLQGSGSGAIKSGVSGGLILSGGAADWPTFSANRTLTRYRALLGGNVTSGTWTYNTGGSSVGIVSGATGSVSTWGNITVHNGATLSTVVLTFRVGQSHANAPQNAPQVNVYRVDSTGLASNLNVGGAQTINTGGSGAAWYNSGNTQTFTFTCNQNNVIDTSTYTYLFNVNDESGTNSLTGNIYHSIQLNFTTISDMRFA